MKKMSMTYAGVGIDYDAMDPFKMACQVRAMTTDKNARRLGFESISFSRGESAFLLNEFAASRYHTVLGHVEEGLGTKNMVADRMALLSNKSYYGNVAQCTVAMMVNDMVTLGVLPIAVAMHLAVGESSWFNDERRSLDLINGWGSACDLARCVWSGGETPTLKGMIFPGASILSGSAIGKVKNGHKPINPGAIRHGDVIVFVESSGIHANGLTMARRIGDRKDSFWRKLGHLFFPNRFKREELPDGYMTKLSDGRTYGEALLDPTHIYVGLVEDCLDAGVHIHYAVNITGHGWRKLMRARQQLEYVVETLPTQLPIFDFIQRWGPVDDEEAYGNLNMGAGFALYMAEAQADRAIAIARRFGLRAFVAGHIEDGDKKVVIKPKSLVYLGKTLSIR